jgi:hypothetical protein
MKDSADDLKSATCVQCEAPLPVSVWETIARQPLHNLVKGASQKSVPLNGTNQAEGHEH